MNRLPLLSGLFEPSGYALPSLAWACLLVAGSALTTSLAIAAEPELSQAAAPAALSVSAKKAAVPAAKSISKPEWHELNPTQQKALKPLAANWGGISEGHKRKWLAISQNFAALPATEQARMHGRMTEWAALSPQERSQARLNYAGARELTPDDRLAKWQAYQALSAEQKQQLAATAAQKPVGAATAVRPVPPQKLAVTPVPIKLPGDVGNSSNRHTPKIAAAPHQVDHNTLLPQQVPMTETSNSQ